MDRGLNKDIGKIVEALRLVYEQRGDESAAALLTGSDVQLEVTDYDNWNGGTYTYAAKVSVPPTRFAVHQGSVERLEEDLLQGIQSFARIYANEFVEEVVVLPQLVEGSGTSQEPITRPSFWREGFLRLFISHVAQIKSEATELAAQLELYGISAFVAHEDIEPTREWENEIRLALGTCDGLIALLTPGFPQSKWTDQEVGLAVGRDLLVIPVRMGLDPYGFIGRFQGFQGLEMRAEDLAKAIFAIAVKHPKTQQRMSQALVSAFEESRSFAEAKKHVANLHQIEQWTEPLAGRARRAVEENNQISGAFGVAERLERLLRQAGFATNSATAAG
jgi:hypothetical protein